MTPQPVCQTATFGFQRRNNYYKRDKQRERLGGREGFELPEPPRTEALIRLWADAALCQALQPSERFDRSRKTSC
jgi:hypothetical protein